MSWWRLLVHEADSLLTERPGFTRSRACAAVEGGLPALSSTDVEGVLPGAPGQRTVAMVMRAGLMMCWLGPGFTRRNRGCFV